MRTDNDIFVNKVKKNMEKNKVIIKFDFNVLLHSFVFTVNFKYSS